MHLTDLVEIVKNTLTTTLKIPKEQEIDVQASLKENYGLDSMSSLTFLMALEDSVKGFFVNVETLEERDLQNAMSVAEYVSKSIQK